MTSSFVPQPWVDGPGGGTPITAERLNRIEAGIAAASVSDEFVIQDLLNSWWALPCAVYDQIRDVVHVTGVTRGSTVKIGTFDLGLKRVRETNLGSVPFAADDHYTPALLVEPQAIENRFPIVAWSSHDQDAKVRTRKGVSWDLPSLAAEVQTTPTNATPSAATAVSYAQLLSRVGTPNTVAFLARMMVAATPGHYLMRSTDRGATWPATLYRLHGKDYSTWKLSSDGGTAFFAVTQHPISSTTPDPQIFVFKVNLTSGVISKVTAATTIANFWTDTPSGTTAMVSSASMDSVVSSDATWSHRLLDVSNDGLAVLTAKFARADLTNGTFVVYRWNGAAWVAETIGATGAPFGYTASFYIGGGVFDGDANTLWLVQEAAGVYSLAKWTASAGVWTKGAVIRTAPGGSKIGRPRVPVGAEGVGIVTWGEYVRYSSANFNDYYGHQRLVDLR